MTRLQSQPLVPEYAPAAPRRIAAVRKTSIGRAVLQAVSITVIGAAIATALNWPIVSKGQYRLAAIQEMQPWRIKLDQLRELYNAGGVIVVDARSRAEYEAGHIAGAVYFNFDQYQETLASMSRWLPPEDVIAVVTPGGIERCQQVRQLLNSQGYTQVKCLTEPVSQWASGGGPIAKGWDMDPLLEAQR